MAEDSTVDLSRAVPPSTEEQSANVSMLDMLSEAGAIAARQITRAGMAPIPQDTYLVTDLLKTVVTGIAQGKNFSHIYPTLSRLVNQQESRANLINQLLVFDEYRRAASWTELRNELEVGLIAAAKDGTLRPAERLILLEMADKKLVDINKRIAGGAAEVNDVLGLLQKANYAVEAQGEELKQRFAKTSYQGREIVRKLLTTLSRALADQNKAPKA